MQRGLLFRKPTLLPQDVVDHLKTSLSRTLDFIYPVAGRLATTVNDDDNTACFFINCNGAGASFIHAAADGVTVEDILDPVKGPRIMYSFFPNNEARKGNFHGVTEPLLAVQVTELADGISISCTMNHAVADETSLWHFLNSWLEISRGGSLTDKPIVPLQNPPVFDRWLVPQAHFPVRIPQSTLDSGDRPSSTPVARQIAFRFKKEKIAALKAKANAEKDTNRISSLQALSAYLRRSINRLPEDQETTCILSIGMRGRVNPPSPEQYFGIALQGGRVTMTVGELLEADLGDTAWRINQMISSFSHATAANFFESWAGSPRLTAPTFSNVLVMSGSPRFNAYGDDFGWGRPVAVRKRGGNNHEGKMSVYQGAEEGIIEIDACLSL